VLPFFPGNRAKRDQDCGRFFPLSALPRPVGRPIRDSLATTAHDLGRLLALVPRFLPGGVFLLPIVAWWRDLGDLFARPFLTLVEVQCWIGRRFKVQAFTREMTLPGNEGNFPYVFFRPQASGMNSSISRPIPVSANDFCSAPYFDGASETGASVIMLCLSPPNPQAMRPLFEFEGCPASLILLIPSCFLRCMDLGVPPLCCPRVSMGTPRQMC